MDSFTLECFLAVAETKSFTRASKKLMRTQSAISQQIHKLEKTVEKKLFARKKAIELTDHGQLFYHYAKKIYALHEELFEAFSHDDLEGEVRFGLPEDFATIYLPDILKKFSELHPKIQLFVECDLTLNLFSRFKKKEFDLVLVKMGKPEDFPHGTTLFTEPLEWVSNIELQAKGTKDDPIPLVLAPKPCVYRARAIEALEKNNLSWKAVYTSPSYAGTIAAVKAGLGITALARPTIPKNLQILSKTHLPPLEDTHISLVMHSNETAAMLSLEEFIMKKLTL